MLSPTCRASVRALDPCDPQGHDGAIMDVDRDPLPWPQQPQPTVRERFCAEGQLPSVVQQHAASSRRLVELVDARLHLARLPRAIGHLWGAQGLRRRGP